MFIYFSELLSLKLAAKILIFSGIKSIPTRFINIMHNATVWTKEFNILVMKLSVHRECYK